MITEKAKDRGSQRCMHLYLSLLFTNAFGMHVVSFGYADCFRLSELDYVNFKIKR